MGFSCTLHFPSANYGINYAVFLRSEKFSYVFCIFLPFYHCDWQKFCLYSYQISLVGYHHIDVLVGA